MLAYLAAMLAGFVLLVWGADQVVLGAGATARLLGVAPMLIGLTIVGFATSAPEVLVAAAAAFTGSPSLAIGNALGSNIANIGLVIGFAAMIHPMSIRSLTLRQELPVMLAVSVIPAVLFPDGMLGRIDGLLLLAALTAFMFWVVRLGMRTRGRDPIEAQYAAEIPAGITRKRAAVAIAAGLAALLVGANALVWGSRNVALEMGVSELLIGVTVVAVGTSLPELAVSLASARKGEHGLALGNVIGSNVFNLLAVIGVAATIRPVRLESDALLLHLPVMVAFTLAFFVIAYNRPDTIAVGRAPAGALLAGFLAYQGYVVTSVL